MPASPIALDHGRRYAGAKSLMVRRSHTAAVEAASGSLSRGAARHAELADAHRGWTLVACPPEESRMDAGTAASPSPHDAQPDNAQAWFEAAVEHDRNADAPAALE